MPKVATQIRLDEVTHAKLKCIAEKELRSLNAEMEYLILKGIEAYEEQYGLIDAHSLLELEKIDEMLP